MSACVLMTSAVVICLQISIFELLNTTSMAEDARWYGCDLLTN